MEQQLGCYKIILKYCTEHGDFSSGEASKEHPYIRISKFISIHTKIKMLIRKNFIKM